MSQDIMDERMDERRATARIGIEGTARMFWRGGVHLVRISNAPAGNAETNADAALGD